MKGLAEILLTHGVQTTALTTVWSSDNIAAWEQEKADRENAEEGTLTGYDCRVCKNKGYVVKVKGIEQVQYECSCMQARRSMRRIEKSGLSETLDKYTFDSFNASLEWQKPIKSLAMEYSYETGGKWFYMGGQPGSGKTHLCTAIVGSFLSLGRSARYMLWRDEIVKIKAAVNDSREYEKLMSDLKNTDVLYIDDFLKTQRGVPPTSADINVAFELLNSRYNRKALTLMSGEYLINEIIDIDEALGSRIRQMCGKYCVGIPRDKGKNYRLKERA